MTVKLLTSTNLLFYVLVCLSLGCTADQQDPTLGTVSGRVTLDDAAFSNCKVAIYSPESFKSRGAQVDADGAYEISKVAPGDYIVMVLPPVLEDDAKVAKIPIPRKLRSRKTSNLSVTVKASENTEFNVEL